MKKEDTASFHRILTVNLDLIVLQCLAGLISGHTSISPSILFFSIKNLQCSSTCGRTGDEKMTKDETRHTIFLHMWSQTWEDSNVAAGLKRSAILEPGDESRRVGLDLTQHRGGTVQSYCHLLRRTIRTRTSNSRRYWPKKNRDSLEIVWIILVTILTDWKVCLFVPRTLRLKCRLRSPALLDARQLYLPVSATWAPEIWRKRPWDKTWCRPSSTNSCPSFSHLMSGTGLPGKLWAQVNKVAT